MELDEADIKILRALQGDARLSFRELADIAAVSTPTVSSKVKTLEEKGVLRGYHADIAPEALGEQVYVLDVRAKPADLAGVAARLAALPQVRSCHIAGTGRVVAVATLVQGTVLGEFLAEVSGVPDIQAVDALPRLRTVKEEPTAVIDRGVALTVRCEFCGRMSRGDVQRLRVGKITHYVCCKSCKAGLAERLRKFGSAGAPPSDLPVAEP